MLNILDYYDREHRVFVEYYQTKTLSPLCKTFGNIQYFLYFKSFPNQKIKATLIAHSSSKWVGTVVGYKYINECDLVSYCELFDWSSVIESVKAIKNPTRKRRDSQQSKLYNWERHFVDNNSSNCDCKKVQNKDDILKIVNASAVHMNIELDYQPSIEITSREGGAACWYWMMRFNGTWSRQKWIVVHETAHYLTYRTYKTDPGHGEYYCLVYAKLLSFWFGWDLTSVINSMRSFGLKVANVCDN